MAEYGILIKIGDASKIKGNVKLADYTDNIGCDGISFSSSSARQGAHSKNVSVTQNVVSAQIANGAWVALLQSACYNVDKIGDVVICQLASAESDQTQAKPTLVQKLTLTNAVITTIDQSWDTSDSPRTVSISLSFEKILLNIGDKSADFVLKNMMAAAV